MSITQLQGKGNFNYCEIKYAIIQTLVCLFNLPTNNNGTFKDLFLSRQLKFKLA